MTEISKDKLAELKQKDVHSELMGEMDEFLPNIKKVLIDERDIYLSEMIKATTGICLVAMVGAGHLAGIQRQFSIDNSEMLAEISTIPHIKWLEDRRLPLSPAHSRLHHHHWSAKR